VKQIQILETQITLEEYEKEEELEVARLNFCVLQEEASTRNLDPVPERREAEGRAARG